MQKSVHTMTCPKLMSRNLLTTAAMMSVPPVEPLLIKTTASPTPSSAAPMRHDIKGLSRILKWCCVSTGAISWNKAMKPPKQMTPMMVLNINLNPKNLRATPSRIALNAQ